MHQKCESWAPMACCSFLWTALCEDLGHLSMRETSLRPVLSEKYRAGNAAQS